MPSLIDWEMLMSPRAAMVQPRQIPSAYEGLGDFFLNVKKQKADEELRRQQLLQQDEQHKAELAQRAKASDLEWGPTGVRSQALQAQERERQETNDRLERQAAEKHINDLTEAWTKAQASGDVATQNAIQQELQRSGFAMKEFQSELAGQPAPVPEAPPEPKDTSGYTPNGDLESGGNPRARNPTSGASGIFQALPGNVKAMGYTQEQWDNMSADEQRQAYKERFLPRVGGFNPQQVSDIMGDKGENYLAIAATGHAGRKEPDETPIYKKGTPEYDQNPVWDRDKNGVVTAGEIRSLGREGAGSSVLDGGAPETKGMVLPDQEIGPPEKRPAFLDDYMMSEYGVSPGQRNPDERPQEVETPGGGRFVFYDKTGNKVFEYDRAKIQKAQAEQSAGGLQSILDAADTPEKKRAAEAAVGMARQLAGQGRTVKEAQDVALKYYQTQIGEGGKTERANIMSDYRTDKALAEGARADVNATASTGKLAAMNQAENDINDSLAALGANNGTGDVFALRKALRAVEGGRTSDQDYKSVIGSAGWLQEFLNLPEKALEGRLPPELMQNLRSNLQATAAQIRSRREALGKVAEQRVVQGNQFAPPEKREKYREYAKTPFQNQTPTGPPTPAPGGQSDVEDLIKKALEGR